MGFSDSDIVISHDTPKYRFLKKHVMVAMKQHGDGLKHLETMTIKHVDEMLNKMENYNGAPFSPGLLMRMTIASIMLTLIYGKSSEEDVKNFYHDEEQFFEVIQQSGPYMMLDAMPILRFIIPSVKKAFADFMTQINITNTLFDNITIARRNAYEHPRVEFFIDHFLKLLNMSKSEGDKSRIVDETTLSSMGIDMLYGGMTTTSKTLEMMLAILVNHPEIQDKTYKEINEAIGNRKPRIEDRISMPFVEALILETLRYHSLFVISVPHQARLPFFMG